MTLEDAKNYMSKMIGISAVERCAAQESAPNARAFYEGQEDAYRDAREILAKVKPDPDEEDRGWQDAEDEGVEVIGEQMKAGKYFARWESTHEGPWLWSVHSESGLQRIGLEPDRIEARKAAVEAARGINEN